MVKIRSENLNFHYRRGENLNFHYGHGENVMKI